ncbi:hypothetical protein Xen7305DRAFT_00014440 [Xenococcus sp. PCC 7305]|uniref:PFE-CTERM domain-containing protein n=1 Tax=Xenococcus sp. PCC 7305 TaxID=102125 RepID=UPI0002AC1954|nr:hypothetical protein [Xenococcus sp. PCC 7305]ELS01739.1 hypothetical protein Xen7305DRAFT_00014440 [Xenococcus sp. PCC 7305]
MSTLGLPKISIGLATLAVVVGAVSSAEAFTLTTFNDRESWESAVAGDFNEENFNSFTIDSSFNGVNLDVGDFTLNGTGNRQKIDAPAMDVPAFSVDGSPMILGQTDSDSSFMVKFDLPVTAFGADFDDITSQGVTQLIADSDVVGSIPLNGRFFGFTVDSNITTITLNSANGGFDGFGMDNFVYVSSNDIPVSESPTRAMQMPSDIANPFVPVEFSPTRGIPLTFENIRATPFTFSPALGLLGVGGIWVLFRLRKMVGKK